MKGIAMKNLVLFLVALTVLLVAYNADATSKEWLEGREDRLSESLDGIVRLEQLWLKVKDDDVKALTLVVHLLAQEFERALDAKYSLEYNASKAEIFKDKRVAGLEKKADQLSKLAGQLSDELSREIAHENKKKVELLKTLLKERKD